MKKIILLFLLCHFSVFAKFIPGTVTFNNGSERTGLLEIPDHNDSKLKFRANKEAETEKLKIEDVKGFSITDEKGRIYRYVTLKLSHPRMFKDEFRLDDDKSWALIETEGIINVVSVYFFQAKNGARGSTNTETVTYYIWHPGDDFASMYYKKYLGAVAHMNPYKEFEYLMKRNFEKTCPKILLAINKEDFKANGPLSVVELYRQNCQ